MLAELPGRFRSACHWFLYAEAILGDEGLPSVQITPGAPMSQRIQQQKMLSERLRVQALVFPEGDDG